MFYLIHFCLFTVVRIVFLNTIVHLLSCCAKFLQGWEFAHRYSERIARYLPKNEQMSDSLKKMSNSLICSFLVSNLSDSLTIAHFLWVTWANRSWSLILGEQPERFAHIAHFWWATWAIHSHHSPKNRKWAICSFFQ